MAGKPAAACNAAICALAGGRGRIFEDDRLDFAGDFGQDERVGAIGLQLRAERPAARLWRRLQPERS